MDPIRKRSSQRIGIVLLLMFVALCPGVRPIVHRHAEYGQGAEAASILDWHLASFHRNAENAPWETPEDYHLHWLLVCQDTVDPHCQVQPAGLGDIVESPLDSAFELARVCVLDAWLVEYSFSSVPKARCPGCDVGTSSHSMRLVRSAHALYGIARI